MIAAMLFMYYKHTASYQKFIKSLNDHVSTAENCCTL